MARAMSRVLAARIVDLCWVRAEWIAVKASLREETGRIASERAAREAERAESAGVEVVRDMVGGCNEC